MNVDPTMTVGQIAAEHPLATRVFARHRIDFCCGGGKPLAEVCAKKGLDPARIVQEIDRELAESPEPSASWNDAPLAGLIDYIQTRYHQPLYEELPRLEAMARRVHAVHGSKDPQRLSELAAVVSRIRQALEQHMAKEDQILFPMIREGQTELAAGPIDVMQHEHDEHAVGLGRLRELTDEYQVPPEACNTWRALWHGLAALEQAMHQHIHLENNILFPRALAG